MLALFLPFLMLGSSSADCSPPTQQSFGPLDVEIVNSVGAGRTVTEKIVRDGGRGRGTVHYEGLGEPNVNSGKRYLKLSDGTWQHDGEWTRHGDDIDVIAGGELAQTNTDMGLTTEKSGVITNVLGGGSGSWADV